MTRHSLTAVLLATAAPAVAAEPAAGPLVLERVVVRDPMVNNMVGGTLLKPKGWKAEGGMKWYPETVHQVCFEAKVYDPNGLEQYEALPWCYAVWLTRPLFPIPRMSNYQGKLVLEPAAPAEVVEKLTLGTCRKQVRPRVVGQHDMPEVAKSFARTTGTNVRAVRTRVEYAVNGQPVEEDFFLVLGYTSADIGGGCVCTIWGPVIPPFALRAAKGELDNATPRLLAVAHSGWVNPKWAEQVDEVQGMFLRRIGMAIADAGKISRQISANNDHLLGLMRSAREYRAAVEDRAAKNFSDYIRGVQPYTGGGATYTLPGGYNHAWVSSGGSVVLSNDPNYDPNSGGTGTWTNLRPATR